MTSKKAQSRGGDGPTITLQARGERHLIRPRRSYRHICFSVGVGAAVPSASLRTPVTMALVVDRSGSMQGDKVLTAKRAAQAVVDHLDERDQVVVVAFDDQIEVVQRLAAVTPAVKAAVVEALKTIEARGSTALHEGWLTGCHLAAADTTVASRGAVSRCFLLTDGQANQGLTDAEAIATQAAEVRAQGGVGTSTFGIGDYDDSILGPLAVAGGGQFHHLRTAAEIATTFISELGELLAVAVRQVRLEIEADDGVTIEVVSEYRAQTPKNATRHVLTIGELLAGEERQVVVRCGFSAQPGNSGHTVRARLVWMSQQGESRTEWQEVGFTYASNAACDAEERDPAVMHWVGLHHAYKANLEAMALNKQGDAPAARRRLQTTAGRIATYASGDADLMAALPMLVEAEQDLESKERRYQVTRTSRGQRDHRSGPAGKP